MGLAVRGAGSCCFHMRSGSFGIEPACGCSILSHSLSNFATTRLESWSPGRSIRFTLLATRGLAPIWLCSPRGSGTETYGTLPANSQPPRTRTKNREQSQIGAKPLVASSLKLTIPPGDPDSRQVVAKLDSELDSEAYGILRFCLGNNSSKGAGQCQQGRVSSARRAGSLTIYSYS